MSLPSLNDIPRLLLWLAVLGALVLVATRVLSSAADKANAQI